MATPVGEADRESRVAKTIPRAAGVDLAFIFQNTIKQSYMSPRCFQRDFHTSKHRKTNETSKYGRISRF